ncbi:MAG TPA: hypothetical protein VK538_07210, partial [Solirubrobacteraceae bacterium]|nr:hypothetical protein [Solirubrobacteraceae bacterium]
MIVITICWSAIRSSMSISSSEWVISERFGDERRTEISHSEDEIDIEDLIADQQKVITITQSGYVKSLPLATYR